MTARRLDHVSVTVSDLDRSVAFYHGLLDIPLLGIGEEEEHQTAQLVGEERVRFRYADLDVGEGQILELLQYLVPQGTPLRQRVFDPGSGHVAIRVEGLDAVVGRLAVAGVRPRSAPVRLDGPDWWAGARVVYVSDPDGVAVELVERPSDSTGSMRTASLRSGRG
jgi:catechol 2,3-dioxygenase-like lactoylglutathione lyase family enzyme